MLKKGIGHVILRKKTSPEVAAKLFRGFVFREPSWLQVLFCKGSIIVLEGVI